MFQFLEHPVLAKLFGGADDGAAARPAAPRAGRPAAARGGGDADATQGAADSADLSELFAGLVEEVSPEVAEIAAPEQQERFHELAAAGPTAARQQCSDSQEVDDAIEKSKDAGDSRADQILAGARADDDKVHFDGSGFLTGRDRLKDMMRDTAGVEIDDGALNHGDGKIHSGPKAGSWCGIWAADIWRRAGVPVKWDTTKGSIVDEATGEPLKQEGINAKNQADLAKLEPGDIITIQTLPAGQQKPVPPEQQKSVPRNLNHHAIVESRVYEGPNGGERITVPPGEPPEGGKIIGFNVREGNMPELTDPDKAKKGDEYFNSVHGRFVPAAPTTSTDAAGNSYQTGITTRIALPPEKAPEPPAEQPSGGGGMEWEEDPHHPGRWRPVTPEEITHDPLG